MQFVYLFFLFCTQAYAQMNYSLDASYRSVPSGYDLSATAAYDSLLWGELNKSKPLYGYYRGGITLGGTPTAAAFIQVAPIAPIIFEIKKSAGYRYAQSSTFDCTQVYCFGVIDRTDMSVMAVGGYSNLLGLVSYMYRELRLPISSHDVVSDLEYFTAAAGQKHTYHELRVALAYVLENQHSLALNYTASQVSYQNKKSSSLYGLYRWNWLDVDWAAGYGNYKTDQPDVGGPGFVLTLGKKFGDSLSLF